MLFPVIWPTVAGVGLAIAGFNNRAAERATDRAVAYARTRETSLLDDLGWRGGERQASTIADHWEKYRADEFHLWSVLMYATGGVVLLSQIQLSIARWWGHDNVARAHFDGFYAFAEVPVAVAVALVNLFMLYRNCSDRGGKVPTLRAHLARGLMAAVRADTYARVAAPIEARLQAESTEHAPSAHASGA
jgi:hypothetical protein